MKIQTTFLYCCPITEIKISKPAITPEEPLHAEIQAFLHAVRTRENPVVPLEDGRRALAVALEVLEQIEDHRNRLNLAGSE